jgi:hypothetical protein
MRMIGWLIAGVASLASAEGYAASWILNVPASIRPSGILIAAVGDDDSSPKADTAKKDASAKGGNPNDASAPSTPAPVDASAATLRGTALAVSPDKEYAQLSDDEKRVVKSPYDAMAETDEPPYPLRGQRAALDVLKKAEKSFDAEGELYLLVDIDEKGKALKVSVMKSPDDDLTMAVAGFLMLQKYKPAVCKGIACRMQYPFRITRVEDQ